MFPKDADGMADIVKPDQELFNLGQHSSVHIFHRTSVGILSNASFCRDLVCQEFSNCVKNLETHI